MRKETAKKRKQRQRDVIKAKRGECSSSQKRGNKVRGLIG